MKTSFFPQRLRSLALALTSALLLSLVLLTGSSARASGGFYQQHNLVSDIPGLADVTDPNLLNPWGIVHSATSPFWISDNNAGVSTLYNGAGTPFPPGHPLVVTIPPPASMPDATAAPTGVVFNGTSDFVVSGNGHSGPAIFIFATEDGTISGWNPTVNLTHAVLKVDHFPGSVYKGLALGSTEAGNFLFAANFRTGRVDVFNTHFEQVSSGEAFRDHSLPSNYAPFGIANIGGNLYVTFARQNEARHDDVAGPGHGFVDVFSTKGKLLRRFATEGTLNSPWGLALALANFGTFSNDLLVGNFGDGRINAFDPATGAFRGQLSDKSGQPIVINGLWGLAFGNDHNAGPSTTLFFTAGINDEADGLFGSLQFHA